MLANTGNNPQEPASSASSTAINVSATANVTSEGGRTGVTRRRISPLVPGVSALPPSLVAEINVEAKPTANIPIPTTSTEPILSLRRWGESVLPIVAWQKYKDYKDYINSGSEIAWICSTALFSASYPGTDGFYISAFTLAMIAVLGLLPSRILKVESEVLDQKELYEQIWQIYNWAKLEDIPLTTKEIKGIIKFHTEHDRAMRHVFLTVVTLLFMVGLALTRFLFQIYYRDENSYITAVVVMNALTGILNHLTQEFISKPIGSDLTKRLQKNLIDSSKEYNDQKREALQKTELQRKTHNKNKKIDQGILVQDIYSNLLKSGDIINIAPDGNCFFHAVAEALNRQNPTESLIDHLTLRNRALAYINDNPEAFPDNSFVSDLSHSEAVIAHNRDQYITKMSRAREYADGPVIAAMALALNLHILIIDLRTLSLGENEIHLVHLNDNDETKHRLPIVLLRHGQHYDMVNYNNDMAHLGNLIDSMLSFTDQKKSVSSPPSSTSQAVTFASLSLRSLTEQTDVPENPSEAEI